MNLTNFMNFRTVLCFSAEIRYLCYRQTVKWTTMGYRGDELVRFDWAMKRLLRQKANFVVLESFLSELLKEKIKIQSILESEGNKESEDDKFNKVDLLAENTRKELILVEVQNTTELYYFQRMLYGTSKAITDYIYEGDKYSAVRKVYSVNIVYFDLGQGNDYIYHGKSVFTGVHTSWKDGVHGHSQGRLAEVVREATGHLREGGGGRPVPGVLHFAGERVRRPRRGAVGRVDPLPEVGDDRRGYKGGGAEAGEGASARVGLVARGPPGV